MNTLAKGSIPDAARNLAVFAMLAMLAGCASNKSANGPSAMGVRIGNNDTVTVVCSPGPHPKPVGILIASDHLPIRTGMVKKAIKGDNAGSWIIIPLDMPEAFKPTASVEHQQQQ